DAAGGGALGRVARPPGATPGQVAIALLLARSPGLVPIPRTSSVAHLDENVAAARTLLSTAALHELSRNGCSGNAGAEASGPSRLANTALRTLVVPELKLFRPHRRRQANRS